MRAALFCCAIVAALGAAMIPDAFPEGGPNWSCTAHEVTPDPVLAWVIGDRCTRWEWRAER